MVIFPAIFRFCNADRIGYKLPWFFFINLCQIQPCSLIHRKELSLRPHGINLSLIGKGGHIKGNYFSFFTQRGAVFFHYHNRFRPVISAHRIAPFPESAHTGLFTVKLPRCCRMKHIELSIYLMKFRCPEEPSYSRISIRIQKKTFFSRYNTFQRVRTSHVKGMVIIRVICCQKIIFSVFVHANRIRTMFGKRCREILLMHLSPDDSFDRIFPVYLPLHSASIAVDGNSLHIF